MTRSASSLPRVMQALRQHAEDFRTQGIRHMFVFGSVARGEDDDFSDVDIAIEFDPRATPGLMAVAALQRQLASLLQRKVDVVSISPHTKRRMQAFLKEARHVF